MVNAIRDYPTSHSPDLIHPGCLLCLSIRLGQTSLKLDGTHLVPGSEDTSRDNLLCLVDSFPVSISESDSDMSWSLPSEDLSVAPPSSDLSTDSSSNTEVSSSSRSRLESAFHAITLGWGWETTVDTVSCNCTDSGLELDLGARSFLSRSLVLDRVSIRVWLSTDLGLLGMWVETNLTGKRRFLCSVFTLPRPSRRRTLNTGIEALGCEVTT